MQQVALICRSHLVSLTYLNFGIYIQILEECDLKLSFNLKIKPCLRLLDTYAAITHENWPPLHVSLKNSGTRWSSNKVIEANVQGGSDFYVSSRVISQLVLWSIGPVETWVSWSCVRIKERGKEGTLGDNRGILGSLTPHSLWLLPYVSLVGTLSAYFPKTNCPTIFSPIVSWAQLSRAWLLSSTCGTKLLHTKNGYAFR